MNDGEGVLHRVTSPPSKASGEVLEVSSIAMSQARNVHIERYNN